MVCRRGVGGDWVDTGSMQTRLIEHAANLPAQSGWNDVVRSLKGAIDDPSHINVLGIAAAVMIAVWVNYRLARWLLARSQSRSS